jgi:hypothetical protein
MKVQRGIRDLSTKWGGWLMALPATLPLGKTQYPWYPVYRRLGGTMAGLDGWGKSYPHWGSIP